MSRQSSAQLKVKAPLDAGNIEALQRLKPPSDLNLDERRVWKEMVDSRPPEWFGLEHVPIMVGYVTSTVAAEIWERLARQLDPKVDGYPEQFQKFRLLATRERKMVNVMARAMRLTHQAAFRVRETTRLKSSNSGGQPWDE